MFDVHALEQPSGHVYLAMVMGDVGGGTSVLARVHSECLTGDALSSLRCDCGIQLRQSLRIIAAEQRGVLIYATGHEGRGIGLLNKLRAYVAQDEGADTVDANHLLGLPADARDYTGAAAVLEALGIHSIRLLTNNPSKASGLRAAGTIIDAVVPLPTSAHHRNADYLSTKTERMGHVPPGGTSDVLRLLGDARARPDRPRVIVKYAQTLDGRIATSTGDSRWISGEEERRVSHALRAACDAVMVGVGTVLADDPQLTVRMVPGASPARIVLDSSLRTPLDAMVLGEDAATTIVTTARSDPARRAELQRLGVRVEVVPSKDGRVDLGAALARLRTLGVEALLVEGGAAVITELLRARAVDRLIVSVAPVLIGSGTEAVGALDITRVADGIHLTNRTTRTVGDDLLLACDVENDESAADHAM